MVSTSTSNSNRQIDNTHSLFTLHFDDQTNAGSIVRFFIHVITPGTSEIVVKDSVATTSVPRLDHLIAFLQRMLVENGTGEEALIRNCGKVASEHKIQSHVSTWNAGFIRAVEGQNIVSTCQSASNSSNGNKSPPTSPFSDAFCNDYSKTRQPNNATTNPMTDMHAFEDAFLDHDTRSGSLSSDMRNPSASVDDDYEEETTVFSNVWSKQRIKGLEKCIAAVAPCAKLSLTKQMLATAEVIGQVDLKFIIVKTGDGILCAVDQHAADERIALEKLESSLRNHSHGDTTIHLTKRSIKVADVLKHTKLLPSKRVSLSQKQISTVKYHWTLLHKWNFTVEELDETTLLLTGVPSVCDRVASVNEFFDFIQELGNRVSSSDITPAFVKSILASNACRYAIMFGDLLTHDQCVELISR